MRVFCISILIILFGALCSACNHSEDRNLTKDRDYLNSQINDRIKVIIELPRDSFPEKPDAIALDKRINEIILISKDVENLNASVTLANQLFSGLVETFKFSTVDFALLNVGMHVDEIERLTKQNELAFFNLYILQSASRPVPLFTAH
ncbi:MAG: hypothetical protein JNL60_09515 [Bacteroidia bacterium]|nr:hypothetical protein [Bacteroidia bacterium]